MLLTIEWFDKNSWKAERNTIQEIGLSVKYCHQQLNDDCPLTGDMNSQMIMNFQCYVKYGYLSQINCENVKLFSFAAEASNMHVRLEPFKWIIWK